MHSNTNRIYQPASAGNLPIPARGGGIQMVYNSNFYACGVSIRCEGSKKLSFLIPAKKAQDVRREEVAR